MALSLSSTNTGPTWGRLSLKAFKLLLGSGTLVRDFGLEPNSLTSFYRL
jgi:hypothetical protein